MGWGFFGELGTQVGAGAANQNADDGGASSEDDSTTNDSTTNESTTNESATNESATNESTGSEPDFSAGPAAVLGHQAAALLDKFEEALNGLRERVITWLKGMLTSVPWLFEIVKAVFNALWDMAIQFVKKAAEALRGINAPEALQQAAQEWRDGPTATVAALVPTIQEKAAVVDENWTDEAGRAYAARVPAQVAAVEATQGLGEKTAQTLDDAAKALTAFYADIATLVGRLYTAVKSNSGNVFSLGTLAAVFSGGLGDIVRAVKGIITFSEEMKRLQKEMAEAVTSSGAFPDGRWPVAAGAGEATPGAPGTTTPDPVEPPTAPDPGVEEGDSVPEGDAVYA